MKKCVLGDVADVIVSGVDKKTKDGEEKVRLCNYTDVYYNWAITGDKYDGLMKASAKPEEIRKFKIRKGQVALTKDSETRDDIGIPTYIADDFEDVILGYHCALITPYDKQLDGSYLNALLRTKYAKEFFANNAGGSGQRYYLSDASIKELPLFLPDFAEQKRIGKFFSSIDRKIALNRKRIATLEAMAKEIYDYWFVQFDFPDAHGRPYKSSGGAMVYNPDLKREIPKGWEAKSVNDCGAFFRGVGYSKADERARRANTVLVMRGNNISNGRIVDDSDRVFIDKSLVSAEQLMDRFSVLFAMSSGSKEHVGKAAVYYDYPANAAFGAFCSKYAPQPHYRYMMFCFLASETYRAFVKRICGGTGINNMKPEYFDVPLFAVPHDEALLRKFNDMAEQAYSQIYSCTQEISKLIGLRDFLLPVLMNGQVKVG